jgi:hypothetical protein
MCHISSHLKCPRCKKFRLNIQHSCINLNQRSFCDVCGFGESLRLTSAPRDGAGEIYERRTEIALGVMTYSLVSTPNVLVRVFLQSFKELFAAETQLARDVKSKRVLMESARITLWHSPSQRISVSFGPDEEYVPTDERQCRIGL